MPPMKNISLPCSANWRPQFKLGLCLAIAGLLSVPWLPAEEPPATAPNWTTSLPVAGTTNAIAIGYFSLSSATPLSAATAASAASYELLGAGPNGILGDTDDVAYTLLPAFDGVGSVTLKIADGPIQPGLARFSTQPGLSDTNNSPVEVFARELTVIHPPSGHIESRDNHMLEGATALALAESPAGSGFLTALGIGAFPFSDQEHYWRFQGRAGDHLVSKLETDTAGSYPSLYLLNASGGSLTGSSANSSIGLDIVLPVSGTYYLKTWCYLGWCPAGFASYQMRVDLSRGPQMETGSPSFTIAAGQYRAHVAGALYESDASGDTFALPYLNAGNIIRVELAFPSASSLTSTNTVIRVERQDASEPLAASDNGQLNYVVTADGFYNVRISTDASRGLRAQYLMDLQITDGQPPLVTGCTFPPPGSTNVTLQDSFTLAFSEDLAAGTVNDPANYELRHAGADGQFGSADDELYQVQCLSYSSGLSASYLVPDGPFRPGRYRFIVKTNLLDRVGNSLLAEYAREFVIEGVAGYVLESRSNDSAETATSLDPLWEYPIAGGLRSGWGRGRIASAPASDYDWWSFTGRAGEALILAVDMDPQCWWWGCATRSFYFYGPEGAYLGAWSFGGGEVGVPPILLPADGVYTLRIEPQYAGDYQFQLLLAPPGLRTEGQELAWTTASGHRQARVLGVPASGGGDTFGLGNLSAGTVVDLRVSQPAFSGFAPELRLQDASGLWLATNQPGATNLVFAMPEGSSGIFYAWVGASEARRLKSAYVLDLDLGDGQAPAVTGCSLYAEGGTNAALQDSFTLAFSEDLAAGTVNDPANYELRHAGADGQFGSADDELYQVQCTPAYSSGLSASYFVPDGPYRPGRYRLTVKAGLQDMAGNGLASFTREFVVADLPGYVLESQSNDSAETATSLDPLLEYPIAGGLRSGWGRGRIASAPASDYDWWSFTGRAGEALILAVDMDSQCWWWGCATRSFYFYGPEGAYLGAWSFGGGEVGVPPILLPADGVYTLRIEPQYAGDYQFQLLLAPPGLRTEGQELAWTTASGHRQARVLGVPASGGGDTFGLGNLSAGTVVDLRVSQPAFSSFAPELRIQDASGLWLATNQPGTTNLVVAMPEGSSGIFYAWVGASEARRLKSAYVLDLDLGDGQAPAVTGCSLYTEGGTNAALQDSFTLAFSEDLAAGTVNDPANYELRHAGADGQFGSADDELYQVQCTPAYSGGLSASYFVPDGPYRPGRYRLTVKAGLQDMAGNGLASFTREFVIEGVAGYVFESRSNDSAETATSLDPLWEDPVAGGLRSGWGRGRIASAPASDFDWWSFTGKAGESLILAVDMDPQCWWWGCATRYFYFYGPEGAYLGAWSFGGGEVGVPPILLPADGVYTLRIEPQYAGDYQFQLLLAPPGLRTEGQELAWTTASGHRQARVLGVPASGGGDTFGLGNLSAGTVVDLRVSQPAFSGFAPELRIQDANGLWLATNQPGAANLVVAMPEGSSGIFYAWVGASEARRLKSAYVLDLDLGDGQAPAVTGCSLYTEGGTNAALQDSFTLAFSEDLAAGTVNDPANYELRHAGADGQFGSADDELYQVQCTPAYSGGLSAGYFVPDGPYRPGRYRLTVKAGLQDMAGNGLASFTREFVVADLPGYVLESRSNDSAETATSLDPLWEDPVAGGLRSGWGRGRIASGPASDYDWWSFTGRAGESLILAGRNSLPCYWWGCGGRDYRLNGPDGNYLMAWTLSPLGQGSVVTLPADGLYTLQMSPPYEGDYEFRITLAPPGMPLENEDNGSVGAATRLNLADTGTSLRGSAAGGFATSGDSDYYNLGTLTNGATVYLSARPFSHSQLSLMVGLYDAAGAYQFEAGNMQPYDGAAEVNITQEGVYYVRVRDRNGQYGLFEQYTLDVEVVPTGSVDFPNLIVTGIVPPPGEGLLSGQPAPVSFTVKNAGRSPTPDATWQDRVVLSADTILGNADDLPLGFFSHAGVLPPNATYGVTNALNLPDGIEGDFYLIVQTDHGNTVGEFLLEGDNALVSDQPFKVTRANYPDLRVEGLSVAGPDANDVFTITWDTANRGGAGTPRGFEERLIVKNLATGATVADRRMMAGDPLAAGATAGATQTITASMAAQYEATVIADSQDQIYEFNALQHAAAEQNNTVKTYFDVTLDLQPANLVVLPESGLKSGGTLSIRWHDYNRGFRAAADAWRDRLQVVNTTSGETLLDTIITRDAAGGALAGGEFLVQQYGPLQLPDGVRGAGTLQITVTIDSDNAMVENNAEHTAENNNSASLARVSILADYPDLLVHAIAGPPSALPGQMAEAVWTVTNCGPGFLMAPWSDTLYLAADTAGTWQHYLGTFVSTNALAPGGALTITQSVALPQGVFGDRYLAVITDSGNQIFEASETNNTTVAPQALRLRGADLVVESVSVPNNARFGAPANVSWTVRNKGDAPATVPWTDRLWFAADTNQGSDRILLDQPVNEVAPLAPDATYTRIASINLPLDHGLTTGNFFLRVTADIHGQQPEAREENNQLVSSPLLLSFPPLPDLAVGEIKAPLLATATFPVAISWVITNQGSGLARGPWRETVTLARDALGNEARLLESFMFTNELSPGAWVIRTQSVALPPWIYNDHVLLLAADVNDQVFEANDANNQAASGVVKLQPPPMPDLLAADLQVPARVLPGQTVNLQWTVVNRGNATANGPWTETIYFGPATNPASALALASFNATNSLAPGSSVARAQAVTIPFTAAAGDWLLGVQLDSYQALEEQSTANNLTFAPAVTKLEPGLFLQLPAAEISETAPYPAILATVYRNADFALPLRIVITNSDLTELALPSETVIPANQSSAQFEIGAVDDDIVDGSQQATITVGAEGYAAAAATVAVSDTDVHHLDLQAANPSLIEGQTTTVTVTRDEAAPEPLLVRLRSSSSQQVAIPSSVTIPANEAAATFPAVAVEDTLIEGAQSHTLGASATGLQSATAAVAVRDNDWPTVKLDIPFGSIGESAGVAMANIERTAASSQPVIIDLEASDAGQLWLPARLAIQAGEIRASFPLLPIDNSLVDGLRPVEIRAWVVDSISGARLFAAAPASLDITDNDGPTLTLTVARNVVAEGLIGGNTATVTRNTVENPEPLVVTLTCGDLSEARIPATVTIPAHQTSADFDIDTIQDGSADASQSVAIKAEAEGFNSSATSFVVSDRDLPDLVIGGITLPAAALTEQTVEYSFRLANQGLSAASGPLVQRVFLSQDGMLSGEDGLLAEFTLTNALAVDEYADQTGAFTLNTLPGDYWIIVVADVLNQVEETQEGNNVTISKAPITVAPFYTATVETDVQTALNGTAIPMRGQAVKVEGGPAAFQLVYIHVRVNQSERLLSARSDADGGFTATFQPLPGEAGNYEIFATHPAIGEAPAQDEFSLVGISLSPGSQSQRWLIGSTNAGQITLQNLSEVPVTGIKVTVEGVPANVEFQVEAPESLAGSASVSIPYTIRVGDDSTPTGTIHLRLASDQGATADFYYAFRIERPRTQLATNPGYLQGVMLRGSQSIARFEVINAGNVASGDLDILLPETGWLSLVSAQRIASLKPGEKAAVELALKPAASLALGAHSGSIAIAGAYGSTSISYQYSAVSDLIGSLLVTVTDDFTYSLAGAPKVTNATVILSDAITGVAIASLAANSEGAALLTNLTESYYDLTVRADRHSEYHATLLLAGGQTNIIDAFLQRQFVSYTWTVVPIEIEDRYEFQLETTFETHVPAPVVTITPSTFDLSGIQGDLAQVNVTIANQGLVAARGVKFNPEQHPGWEIQPLATELGDLAAMSSIEVPVTIRRLPAAGEQAVQPAAAGNTPCTFSTTVYYWYPCGPQQPEFKIPIYFFNASPSCYSQPPTPPIQPPVVYVEPAQPVYVPPVTETAVPPEEVWVNVGPQSLEPVFRVLSSLQGIICNECGRAIYDCISKLTAVPAGPVKKWYECGKGIYECWSKTNNPGPYYDPLDTQGYTCVKAAMACAEAGLGVEWGVISLLLEVLECEKNLIDKCLSKGPAGAGAVSPAAMELSPEDQVRLYHARLQAMIDAQTEFYGNPVWLRVKDGPALSAWLGAFNQATDIDSDGGKAVSAAEQAALLGLALPAPLTPADATQYIERWNRTMEYWGKGWIDAANVPAGYSTDFLARDVYLQKMGAALDAQDQCLADGFDGTLEAMSFALRQYQDSRADEESGVCAKVKIQLGQSAVITRNAFEGTLEINNGSGAPLENIQVTLDIRGPDGRSANDLFGIRDPRLENISAVDGTGVLPSDQAGRAIWVFIPTRDAAPLAPTQYTIGGEATYTQGGHTFTLPLFPAPIQVLPDPRLVVKYFWQREVYSDDPFTPETEPAEPFPLAMMVSNQGRGAAKNMRITSAQPKIVDNEKGLLVDFKLIGSQVGGREVTPALNVSLGDIEPGTSAIATWWMTTSIQGRFTDYKASFSHVDALGDKKLSLVDHVETHELTHIVRAGQPEDDEAPDFLANDKPDLQRLPDTLHLSGGAVLPVNAVTNAAVDGAPSEDDLTIQLTAEFPAGWTYLRIPDPADAGYRLVKATRFDGLEIRLNDNVWQTQRTIRPQDQAPTRERWLHLFDWGGTGRYTLVYAAPAGADTLAPSSLVEALPAQVRDAIPVRWSGRDAGGSGLAYFDIFVSVNSGPWLPWLEKTTLQGAVFQGTPGNKYGFYSRASDYTGNREEAKFAPEAETVIAAGNAAPILEPVADQEVNEGDTLRVVLAASDPDGTAGVIVYTLEPGAPTGITLNPLTGELAWNPTETDGGTTALITARARDNGALELTGTTTFAITVREVNNAPKLPPIPGQIVIAGHNLSFTIHASDSDLPANALSFSLEPGAPANAQLNPASGLFTWTPALAEGPATNLITVRVTDNGTPSLSATNTFLIIVKQGNTPPSLVAPETQTVDELAALAVQLLAADTESATSQLTYTLASAPEGVVLNSATGLLTWTPTEAQGPDTNLITVLVADNGAPSLTDAKTFTVVVREVNRPPQWEALLDRTVKEGQPVAFAAAATDEDLPANKLTYSLVGNVSAGASIDSQTGVFTWTPREFEGPSTNLISIRASDNGQPTLSATQSLTIVVRDYLPDFRLIVGSTNVLAGQSESVPLQLVSGLGLTNLVFALEIPTNLLLNPRLTSVAPNLAAEVTPIGENQLRLRFTNLPGMTLASTQELARLEFSTLAAQTSMFAEVRATAVEGWAADGIRRPRGLGQSGRVAVIQARPLLTATRGANQKILLTLIGESGGTYRVEFCSSLEPESWQRHTQVVLTNLSQTLPPIEPSERSMFYRAYRESK